MLTTVEGGGSLTCLGSLHTEGSYCCCSRVSSGGSSYVVQAPWELHLVLCSFPPRPDMQLDAGLCLLWQTPYGSGSTITLAPLTPTAQIYRAAPATTKTPGGDILVPPHSYHLGFVPHLPPVLMLLSIIPVV